MSIERPADRPSNPVAVIGFAVAVLAVLARLGANVFGVLLPVLAQRAGTSYSEISVVFAVIGVVLLLLFAAAAALGLVGVLLPRRPRVLAGMALGVGAAGTVTSLGDLVVPPLVSLLLQG